jgi:uncharacterized protein with HEPN domain
MKPRREFVDYLRDILDVFAVTRALEIIGEAAKKVPKSVKSRYPAVPWREMTGIRDKLIHEYFGVNLEVVWKTIQQDLPALKPLIALMVEETSQRGKSKSD